MPRRDAIPDGFRGHVDAIEPALSGWVVHLACPSVPVTSFLSIDRRHPVPVIADIPRPDVAAAGLGGPNCGFSVDLPAQFLDGAEHELALRLPDGRRLNLPGRPASVALGPVRADLIPAAAASIDAVAELLRRNDFEAGFDPELVGLEHAKAFNAIGDRDRGVVFYARAGNRLVGYGRLDRGQGDARALGVVALTVLEAYRRKGIGDALMRALQRAATAEDLREVWLSVRPDNTPARRLYEKLGFVREANHPPGRCAVPGETAMRWLPRGSPAQR
jgi:ribosomal protein S18 acetylase RimI-like enzyme